LKLREEMRDEIHRIVRELGITTVFVTHDQGEALVLSDIVAVMNGGLIEQIGSPQAIYRAPETRFVADFIGGANILTGKRSPSDTALFLADAGIGIPIPHEGDAAAIAIRPEDIRVVAPGTGSGDTLRLRAMIQRSRFLGSLIEYTAVTPTGHSITVHSGDRDAFAEGTAVELAFDPACLVVLAR
jgi:ABC-type Fe3+/spermidine/putrescine transport system ATPase subunit